MDNICLLMGVEPEEFNKLKGIEGKIISSVMKGFNNIWKPKVKGIKTTFKYSPLRNAIGIYIERGRKQQLVVEKDELNEAENAVVGSLYSELTKRLNRLRLPKENWVDHINIKNLSSRRRRNPLNDDGSDYTRRCNPLNEEDPSHYRTCNPLNEE